MLRSSASLVSEDQNWTTTVQGTTPEYFEIRSWSIASGCGLTQSDVEGGTKVVVLGQTVASRLFGSGDPVGQVVRIKNTPFQVVGVLQAKGQSPTGQDYDDGAFVPVTTFQSKIQGGLQKYLNGNHLHQRRQRGRHRAGADGGDEPCFATATASRRGADDDFSIRNLTEIAGAQQEGTKTMTTLLASIAFVSLLVGGIGIMNIMLVSVTERTREIGVRMAVGAKPHHILAQFLVEALTLSLLGGLLGVAIGIGGGAWLGVELRTGRCSSAPTSSASRSSSAPWWASASAFTPRARRHFSTPSKHSGTSDGSPLPSCS